MISLETWRMRERILQQLGGRCVCACGCDDANLRRLELHHPNGDGNKHRLNLRGINLYKYLSKQLSADRPIDPPLILMCLNCHGELTRFGSCNGGLGATSAGPTGSIVNMSEQRRTEQGVTPTSILPQVDPYAYRNGKTPDEPLPSPSMSPEPVVRRFSLFPWRKSS